MQTRSELLKRLTDIKGHIRDGVALIEHQQHLPAACSNSQDATHNQTLLAQLERSQTALYIQMNRTLNKLEQIPEAEPVATVPEAA